jgi:Carboxypeptidase regulatory-like domain
MTLSRRTGSLVVLSLLVLPGSNALGQSELKGRVVSDSGVPIRGATITLAALRYSVTTDSLGRFTLAGTPGSTLALSLRANGFREDKADVILGRGRPVMRDFVLVSEQTALPEVNPSDRVLVGRITTAEGEPVSYANVQVNGARRVVSDDSGRFSVPFTPGRVSILVRRIGFEPEELKLTEMPDTAVRVSMKAAARVLPGQVVTGKAAFARLDLGGFYRRMYEVERGARVGYFVTPEDLALRNPQNVTDAVQQFPSIRLRPIDDPSNSSGGFNHADGVTLARKFRIEDTSGCPLTVYLDRVRIQPTMVGLKPVDQEINTLVQPHAVAGIEVYPRAAGAPPEFQAISNTCGVVVIWSK